MTETQNQYTLDDVDHFWADDGLPVFFGNREDIFDIAESIGFQIYYVLSNKVIKPSTTSTNKNKTTNNKNNNFKGVIAAPPPPDKKAVCSYKVCNSFVGRTVQEVPFTFGDEYIEVKPSAHYTMPLIPTVIVDKLDQFFRLVDDQHGTESIVMLTYDMDKEGPEGWGVLVPDQENTAAHCNYDPHSIAEMKPDNVMIVGSVHSHPKMSAYASGTDHADQADFDGIHITYGWQKSVNNGATQYHLELQMAGQAYTLQPEDVFEDFVQKEPDPDVVEWSAKVKKELPPSLSTGVQRGQAVGLATTTQASNHSGFQGKSKGPVDPWYDSPTFKDLKPQLETPCLMAVEVPAPISKIHEGTRHCPMCQNYLDHMDIIDHRCYYCGVPVFAKDEPLHTVLEEVSYYASNVKAKIDVPVYMLGSDDLGGWFVSKLTENLQRYVEDELKQYDVLSPYVEDEDMYADELTPACCDKEHISLCNCDNPLTIEEFDNLNTGRNAIDVDLYARGTRCLDCNNYQNVDCPMLVDILALYKDELINNPSTCDADLVAAEHTIDGTNCQWFELYDYSQDYLTPTDTAPDNYESYYGGYS